MLRSYVKLAFKVFARRKFFTFISLFGVSFTLVVLLLATSLLDHAVAPYPPEVRQDRTLGIYFAELRGEHWRRNGGAGFQLLDRYARNLPGVERLSIASYPSQVYSYLNGTRVSSYIKRTDGEFWRILQFRFVEGGPFSPEDVERAAFVAVINESTRLKYFGGEPAVGRSLEVDGQRFRVVGVVPDVPVLRVVPFADVWVPHTTAKSDTYRNDLVGDFMGLLLTPGPHTFPAIQEEFASRIRRAELPDPKEYREVRATAESLVDTVARMLVTGGDARAERPARRLWLVIGALALLFMLLPAVNLVNLNVSRIMERASEIGVRKAFGASSATLVGQFVVENIVLTLLGGAIGLIAAAWLLTVVNGSGLVLYADLRLNYRIFGWGLALALFFGLLSGVYPAWRMSRLHPVQALKGASR